MTVALTSLLLKPAGPDCNLACRYCFYRKKLSLFPETARHRMSDSVLRETMKQALVQCGQGISLSWQGGEPTLMGMDFYRRAVGYQQEFGCGKVVHNAFQTNGILLDKDWAGFFRKYNFLLGVSVDGPRHIHDRYRRSSNGNGSWEAVNVSLKRMVENGVAVNAMSCVSDYSARYPDEIYQFHKSSGLRYMQFIPLLERSGDGTRAPFSVDAGAYARFMCRIFDLWLSDFQGGRPTTSVRLFESLFFSLLGQTPLQCTFQEQCGQYLVIEHNGDVFPCDFFVDTHWKLGNVMTARLNAMLNSQRQVAFRRQKTAPSDCAMCVYRPLCYGGCIKDRLLDGDSGNANYFCRAYRTIFEHTLPTLKRLSARWRHD